MWSAIPSVESCRTKLLNGQAAASAAGSSAPWTSEQKGGGAHYDEVGCITHNCVIKLFKIRQERQISQNVREGGAVRPAR